jgi:hypothetical protein
MDLRDHCLTDGMPSRCPFPRHATQPGMTYLGTWKYSPLQAGNRQPKTKLHTPILLIPERDTSVLVVCTSSKRFLVVNVPAPEC